MAQPTLDNGFGGADRVLLERGSLSVEARLVQASNATFFGRLDLDGQQAACVYKPVRGEQPLWDFPDGTLAAREVATAVVSAALGWDLVPPTVLRDGPYGPGMCQLWVEADPSADLVDIARPGEIPEGWFAVLEAVDADDRPVLLVHADDPRLRRLALFDAVCNNADRKGGHVLVTSGGHVYGVDHGVTFNEEDKLRTVLWGWAGQPLDATEVAALRHLERALGASLGERLGSLLTTAEVTATVARVERLLRRGRFPRPDSSWPAIPWPAF